MQNTTRNDGPGNDRAELEKINAWIDEEIEMERAEGLKEDFSMPEALSFILHNVLANHISDFLASKELTQAVPLAFARRGLDYETWRASLIMIGERMNQEQLPVFFGLAGLQQP